MIRERTYATGYVVRREYALVSLSAPGSWCCKQRILPHAFAHSWRRSVEAHIDKNGSGAAKMKKALVLRAVSKNPHPQHCTLWGSRSAPALLEVRPAKRLLSRYCSADLHSDASLLLLPTNTPGTFSLFNGQTVSAIDRCSTQDAVTFETLSSLRRCCNVVHHSP